MVEDKKEEPILMGSDKKWAEAEKTTNDAKEMASETGEPVVVMSQTQRTMADVVGEELISGTKPVEPALPKPLLSVPSSWLNTEKKITPGEELGSGIAAGHPIPSPAPPAPVAKPKKARKPVTKKTTKTSTSEERRDYARSMVRMNPDLGPKELIKMVKAAFGVGIDFYTAQTIRSTARALHKWPLRNPTSNDAKVTKTKKRGRPPKRKEPGPVTAVFDKIAGDKKSDEAIKRVKERVVASVTGNPHIKKQSEFENSKQLKSALDELQRVGVRKLKIIRIKENGSASDEMSGFTYDLHLSMSQMNETLRWSNIHELYTIGINTVEFVVNGEARISYVSPVETVIKL